MYFIRDNHEPIIDRETWERIQTIKGAPIPEYMRTVETEMVPDISEEMAGDYEMKIY